MSDSKVVLRRLLSDHVGQHNAITQSQLADALDMNPSTLRSELRRLREERGIPIGNLRDGYFVIQDQEELQEYIGHINSEIESKRNTIEHTLEAWDGFDTDSIDVEPGQDTQEPTVECHNCGTEIVKSDKQYAEGYDEPCCPSCYGEFLMNGKSFS